MVGVYTCENYTCITMETQLDSIKKRMWREVYLRYDRNRDGNLTLKEIKPLFDLVFVEFDPKKLLKGLDQNNDGKITKDEFVDMMGTLSLVLTTEAYFYAMDINNDDSLSVEEFRQAMKRIGIMDPKVLENFQRVADSNHNNKITVREFKAFFKKLFT